jgi:predicted MFS family arabinose efflux permease
MSTTGRVRSWAARARERVGILHEPDLRFVTFSTLVSSLGDGIVGVALAWAVLDLTHSATDLGIVMAARTVTIVAVALIGGVVADRMRRRTVMIAADLLRFGGQLAIGALLLSGQATLFEIVASQVLVAAGTSFFEPASLGLIQATAGEHMQEANALKTISMSGSALIGPAIGGALVATVGSSYALIADGASYLLSAVFLLQLSQAARAATDRDNEASTFLADLRGGFHEVASRTWLWATIVNMALGNMLLAAWPVLAPLICRRHYGGIVAFATLNVVFAVGMLAGGTVLLRFKPRHLLRVAMLAFLPAVLPGIALGLRAPLFLIAFLQFFAGIGLTVDNALWWTAMQQHIPKDAISRVSSYDWAGTLAVAPIGYALVGPLAVGVGISAALIGCCIAALVVGVSALLVPDIRRLQSTASPGGGGLAAAEPSAP